MSVHVSVQSQEVVEEQKASMKAAGHKGEGDCQWVLVLRRMPLPSLRETDEIRVFLARPGRMSASRDALPHCIASEQAMAGSNCAKAMQEPSPPGSLVLSNRNSSLGPNGSFSRRARMASRTVRCHSNSLAGTHPARNCSRNSPAPPY